MVPFVLLGAIAVLALVAWFLVLVLGIGTSRATAWNWAAGRPASEVIPQVALLFLVGLACAAVVLLSLYTTALGFKQTQPRGFWAICEALAGGLLIAVAAGAITARADLLRLGVDVADFIVVAGLLAYAMIVFDMRRRSEASLRIARKEQP
ncbi:MAG: hypothetical protein R2826_06600 [Thermoleophilia bacterium]